MAPMLRVWRGLRFAGKGVWSQKVSYMLLGFAGIGFSCHGYIFTVLLRLELLTTFVNPVYLNSLPRTSLSVSFSDDP
jgi:hypothetical protein